MFKAKDKIRKTTEEMELEEIAKLQKQLIQHLRQNEISLKKLNLRPVSSSSVFKWRLLCFQPVSQLHFYILAWFKFIV